MNWVQYLVLYTVVAHLLVILLGAAARGWIGRYDLSSSLVSSHYSKEQCTSTADVAVESLLGWTTHWDGMFFVHLAEQGVHYSHEKLTAMFPGWPALLWLGGCCVHWLAHGMLCFHSAVLVAGVMLNTALHAIAAVYLYRLSSSILPEELSRVASRAFVFCPPLVFLCALYSTAMFAAFAFAGFYHAMLPRASNQWVATASLCIAATVRSNGSLLGGVFLFEGWRRWTMGEKQVLGLVVGNVIRAGLVVLPSLLFQWIMQEQFCVVAPDRPYCLHALPGLGHIVPGLYGYVQQTYWNVGFFRYYTLSNVPQFVLASPVLLLSAHSLWEQANGREFFSRAQWQRVKGLYVLWAAMLVISLTVLHVQVATRFMVAVPPLYWHMAKWLKYSANMRVAILLWRAIFIVVGTTLFATFLPWT